MRSVRLAVVLAVTYTLLAGCGGAKKPSSVPSLPLTCDPLGAPGGAVFDVTPAQAAQLPDIVAGAPAGATIRLADGTYPIIEAGDFGNRLLFTQPGVTLRSASGNAAAVVLDGQYATGALIHVFASGVTIADVTLTRAIDHLVHAFPPDSGPDVTGLALYRLRLIDAGEQFVKINSNAGRTAWVDGGAVACSQFLMTATGRQNIERAFGCYTGGIDAHSARAWIVRLNTFEGIYCEDGEVAEHAIHFWVGSRDTLVENNFIRNVSRGIGFGLVDSGPSRSYPDNPYPGLFVGHYDGVIRNNVIVADIPQYDTGIELDQARGSQVLHNTVVETGNATGSFSSLDYRFANTLVDVRNNLVRRITARDGAVAVLTGNIENVPLPWFVNPTAGDAHLVAGVPAIDAGAASAFSGFDIDGTPHDNGPPDVGADEWRPS